MQNGNGRIPIRISVTGHRLIEKACLPALSAAVKSTIEAIREKVPDSEIMLASNMAEGADQICSGIAKELSVPYIAVLPFEKEEYEKDFEGDARLHFQSMLEDARQVFCICSAEDAGRDRDACYRKAGEYLADHCHLLLTLSNGENADPNGCGAAEIAEYASENGVPVLVLHTPREGEDPSRAGETTSFLNRELFFRTLKQTNRYNRDCGTLSPEEMPELLPGTSGRIQQIADAYRFSDELSNRFLKKYLRVLRVLAVLGLLFTLSFLLYDELNLHFLIFCCGGFLLLSFLVLQTVKKAQIHGRYISFRVLAENMRVQAFLLYAGSSLEVPKILLWTQKYEYPWVAFAVSSLLFGKEKQEPHDIRIFWLEGQRDYHRTVLMNDGKTKRAALILRMALIVSILTYLFAFCLELFLCRTLSPAAAEQLRTVVKIVVGTFSAATLFTANYYGKLSLGRKRTDSGKMAEFFDAALKEQEGKTVDEAFLLKVAREELSENGNWYSYMKDNAPDLGI